MMMSSFFYCVRLKENPQHIDGQVNWNTLHIIYSDQDLEVREKGLEVKG